jgi:hypothetical protein
LQRLTTRQPDDEQIEVAITAMQTAIAADEGRAYVAHPARSAASIDGGAAEGSTAAEPTDETEGGEVGVNAPR